MTDVISAASPLESVAVAVEPGPSVCLAVPNSGKSDQSNGLLVHHQQRHPGHPVELVTLGCQSSPGPNSRPLRNGLVKCLRASMEVYHLFLVNRLSQYLLSAPSVHGTRVGGSKLAASPVLPPNICSSSRKRAWIISDFVGWACGHAQGARAYKSK